MAQPAMATALARAVCDTMARLGFSQEELLTGEIRHTNLVWQAPPLINEATLAGVPLHNYTDLPLHVKTAEFYAFWFESMAGLRHNPYKTIGEDGYRNARLSVRGGAGDRMLRLHPPEGFPDQMTDYAGAILSLEAAHLLKVSAGVQQIVEGPDDYYIVTHDGYEVGVKDGLPLVLADQWDTSVKGFVPDLLRMPRGAVFEGCDYDLISRLRSHLWEHRDRVIEFEGCDSALQTLRVLAHRENLPAVLSAVTGMRTRNAVATRRIIALQEAITTMEMLAFSDRQKITMLKDSLVPEHMTATEFTQKIFSHSRQPPPLLRDSVRDRITQNLREMLETSEQLRAIKV